MHGRFCFGAFVILAVVSSGSANAAPVATTYDDALLDGVVDYCLREGEDSLACRTVSNDYLGCVISEDFEFFTTDTLCSQSSLQFLLTAAKTNLAVMDQTHPKITEANANFEERVKDILKLALGGDADARQALIDLAKTELKNIDAKKIVSDILTTVKNDKKTTAKEKEAIEEMLKDIAGKK